MARNSSSTSPTGRGTTLDTWEVYQTLFADHLESVNAAPSTIRTYGIAVAQIGDFLRGAEFPTEPARVKPEHLRAWMLNMQRPVTEGGRGWTGNTPLQRYRSVSRFFAFLLESGDIKSSPFAKLKPPRVPEKPVPVIGDEDLKKLLKAVSGTDFEARRDRAILSLFIDTGIRVAEMAGIRMEDIDMEEREVTVLGKGRRPRTIRFVKETRTDLLRYLLRRVQHPHQDSEFLWVGKRGAMKDTGIRQMVGRRQQEAGLPKIHPHMFRHTFAHMYLRGGGSEGDLVRITGWRDRQMLDRYGSSVAAERARDAHDRFSPRRLV